MREAKSPTLIRTDDQFAQNVINNAKIDMENVKTDESTTVDHEGKV